MTCSTARLWNQRSPLPLPLWVRVRVRMLVLMLALRRRWWLLQWLWWLLPCTQTRQYGV
jgi:hypothetical protein